MIDKKNKLVVTMHINYNDYYNIQLVKKLKIEVKNNKKYNK